MSLRAAFFDVGDTLVEGWAPPETMRRLREEHPRLRVEVTQREPESALHETFLREFDLVVAEQYPDHAAPWHPGLDRVPLISDPIRLALPPHADWAHIERLADTAELPWVLADPDRIQQLVG